MLYRARLQDGRALIRTIYPAAYRTVSPVASILSIAMGFATWIKRSLLLQVFLKLWSCQTSNVAAAYTYSLK
jgi:hypothetical protein